MMIQETNKQQEVRQISEIRSRYAAKNVSEEKIDTLKKLDRRARRPAEIFAYSFGTCGALVLGVGMCLAMGIIGNLMPLGIVIGVLGIGMVTVNYPIYKRILSKRREKYAPEIVALSDELLNG